MTEYLFVWEFDQTLLLLKPLMNNYLLQPEIKRSSINHTESQKGEKSIC